MCAVSFLIPRGAFILLPGWYVAKASLEPDASSSNTGCFSTSADVEGFTRNLHNMGFIASTYVNLLVDHMLTILRLRYMTDNNVPRRKILTQDNQPLTGHIYPPPFSSFPSSTRATSTSSNFYEDGILCKVYGKISYRVNVKGWR